MDIVIFDADMNELGIIPSQDFIECVTLFDTQSSTGFRLEIGNVEKNAELISRGAYLCDNDVREAVLKLLGYWSEHDSVFIASLEVHEVPT